MTNVLDLAQKKVNLKKVASTNGGEWHGPCPGCGGSDRFHVWPAEMEGKGAYWCRSCGATGDNIQFLRDFDGLSFPEACASLGIALPDRPSPSLSARFNSPVAPANKQEPAPFSPAVHATPADLWQEHAEKFVSWAHKELIRNLTAIAWLEERGIDLRTAKEFRLGWNPGENGKDIYRFRKAWGLPENFRDDGKPKALWIPRGLVIPYSVDGILQRIRIRRPEGEPRYYVLPGSSMSVMVIGRYQRAFVVVESELDAIACSNAARPLSGAVALGSVSAKPDAKADKSLREALSILLALDYDEAGKKAVAWWTAQYPNCHRWPVPNGKDPGDARKMGIDLGQWIRAGLPPALTIDTGSAVSNRKESERIGENRRESGTTSCIELPDLPAAVLELYELLQKNPGVNIINSENRFTVLRNGRYVGGRINELVFRVPEVTDYIFAHPAELIDASNFLNGKGE